MKKKVLALASAMIMAITLSVGVLPEGLTNVLGANTISASAEISGDYEYSILSNGTVEITDYNGAATILTIPSTLDGKSVTSIEDNAFWGCKSLTSVTVSNGIKNINRNAFTNCTSLTSITIPASMYSIGDCAFEDCASLTNITVDESNANYSSTDGVLFNKNKTELICYPQGKTSKTYIIPSTVTNVGYFSFSDCKSLTSIAIPSGMKSIEKFAFHECANLTSMTFPSSVMSIEVYAFSGCKSLASITVDASNGYFSSVDGVLFNKNKTELICYPAGKTGNTYSIPSGVTSIDNAAFNHCINLTSIIIPNGVTSIISGAFEYCTALTSITIPNSVTTIESWAFDHCTSMSSVKISSSVTRIDGCAFLYCTSLKSVTIPSSVTEIGNAAFSNCTSLTSVTIPSSVIIIGNNGFFDCINLTSVVVPSSVTSIGENAFGYYQDSNDNDTLISNFKISGYAGSAAQKYASDSKIAFNIITVAPSSMRVVSATYNSVKIAWASVSGASGYEVWRSDTVNGKNTLVGNVKTNYFTNVNLARTTAYYYKVRTYYIVGGAKVYSGFTTLAAKTNFAAPAPITSLGRTTSSIKFGWNPVYGASGYEVYRSNTSSGTYALIGNVTTNSFNNTRLTRKANYYYKVRAYRFVGKTKVYSNFGTFYAAVKA